MIRTSKLAACLTAFWLGCSPALAQSGLGAGFDAGKTPVDDASNVAIDFGVERDQERSVAWVRLEAEAGVKLVANPGITVRPSREGDERWLGEPLVTHELETEPYFSSPPRIEIGEIREDGQPLLALVSFAYCLTDEICLLDEREIAFETVAVN